MDSFKNLPDLPGTTLEQIWLRTRLETLSVRESRALAAALMRRPLESTAEAVSQLQSLDSYEVCFPAGSYEQLGEFYLRTEARMPEEAIPYADLALVGHQYEDNHPGQFVGNCYVKYPNRDISQHSTSPFLNDDGWSVKLKLASPSVPEGVWLPLPDYDGKMYENSSEVALALDALKVKSLECSP